LEKGIVETGATKLTAKLKRSRAAVIEGKYSSSKVHTQVKEKAIMANQNDTSNRGFASMDEKKQREIASKGGQSVPAEERSFSKDRELASEAGRKGGEESGGGNRKG